MKIQKRKLSEPLETMIIRNASFTWWPGDVLSAPVTALFPAPVIAGGALLTFARVIRLGAVMDDEIKATI